MQQYKVKKYIQVKKAADKLDCDSRTIYKLVQNGELKAIKISQRGMRILVESLEMFIQKKEVNTDEL